MVWWIVFGLVWLCLGSPVGITSPTYRKLLVEVPACSEPKFRHSDLLRSVRSAFPGTPNWSKVIKTQNPIRAHSSSAAVDPGDTAEGIFDLRPLTLHCFLPMKHLSSCPFCPGFLAIQKLAGFFFFLPVTSLLALIS